MISNNTIEKILKDVSIVDVIAARVVLKKTSGSNYLGLCPFHIEKSPSFNVSDEKGLCHCFGCGAGGNVIQFIRDYEQVDFPEAIKIIAEQFNIEVEHIESRVRSQQPSANQVDAKSANTLLRVVNNVFNNQLGHNKDSVQFDKIGISEKSCKDFSIGFAHPNKSLFAQIEANKNLAKVAKHIGLYKNALLTPDGSYRVSIPIKEQNGTIFGLYIHGANPEIIGPKTTNYKNSFFGTDALNRLSHRKIIVSNPLEAARCLDAGLADVCATFSKDTLFTTKLIDKGNKTQNVLIINNTPELFDILKLNLTSYFLSRKQLTDFRVLLLPPNVNISDIYKKNGLPIVEQLIKNSLNYYDLLAKLITDDLRQANSTDSKKVSDYILNLFKSSVMDSSALVDFSWLTQNICNNLNLNFFDVFNDTNELSIELANDEAARKSVQKFNSEINLITLDINGVQQSSLNRVVALIALNLSEATNDPITLKNLEAIYQTLNNETNCFSKVVKQILSDTFSAISTNFIYNELTSQEKEAISEDVGFLMQYKHSDVSFSDLKESIKYVCNKLNIDYIDSLEYVHSDLSFPF